MQLNIYKERFVESFNVDCCPLFSDISIKFHSSLIVSMGFSIFRVNTVSWLHNATVAGEWGNENMRGEFLLHRLQAKREKHLLDRGVLEELPVYSFSSSTRLACAS